MECDMKNKISLIILEDHTILMEALTITLSSFENIDVHGFFATAGEALNYLDHSPVDVALVDYNLPDMDGISFMIKSREFQQPPLVVFLSMYSDSEIVEKAFQHGASAYLPKTASTEELVTAITDVMEGKHYISPRLSE
ncbi:MAG: response regulator transcription factor [Candidatus Xenobiia bacterium LiM19]